MEAENPPTVSGEPPRDPQQHNHPKNTRLSASIKSQYASQIKIKTCDNKLQIDRLAMSIQLGSLDSSSLSLPM